MAYRASDNPDRIKALAAVIAVHAVLGAAILSGLDVRSVETSIERLRTFDIIELPAPPPPPPARQAERAREEEGAAGRKAEPTPVVAPKPEIVVPAKTPVVAAPVAGTGSAPSAGAALSGAGTGAGGSGMGRGGGGRGDFTGFTPARLLNKIPDREYRRISGGRIPRGSATIAFRVNADGRMSNCRITRSSGDLAVDSIVCEAATRHLRFSPARDPDGRAIAQDMSYTPTWRPNY
ncbi:MAG TPA: TonB family protein [Sphingomicrobium sp.]|nr:TonB family protein [Sphingomicrobium sp.]